VRRSHVLGVAALLLLSFLTACTVHASPFPGPRKGKRADDRSWKSVSIAAAKGDAAATLQRAQSYLTDFPEGRHRTQAHLLAGQAAQTRELWTPCHHHLDSYLKLTKETGLEDVAFDALVCRARADKDPTAVKALRQALEEEENTSRAQRAGRELVVYHLRRDEVAPVFEVQALLLDRGLYEPKKDLRNSRAASEELNQSQLAAMQSDAESTSLSGLFAFLRLERSGDLNSGDDGAPARSNFLYAFPGHPLIALIPDADELLARPQPSGPPKVGVLLPLTGRFQVPGNNARRGIEMALADLLGDESSPLAELELILFDTTGDPERAVEGARKLATEDEVLAILGPIVGDEAEAVVAVADELRVPVLMNSQRNGITKGHPTVFNNWVSPDEQVDAALDYLQTELSVANFAIAYPERETAARMVERFWSGLSAAGGSVSFIESYPDGTTDFTKVARRFTGAHYWKYRPSEVDFVLPFLEGRNKPQIASMPRDTEPGVDFEAFFVPDHFRAMSMFTPGFVSEGINLNGYFGDHRGTPIPIITGAAANHPALLKQSKRFAEGLLLVDSFFAGSHEPSVQRFVLQYELLYGTPPAVLESACYDSARLLFELIDRGTVFREDLIANLSLTVPSASILRSIGFDEDREMKHSLLVLKVEKGQFKQISPQPPENPLRYELGEQGILLGFQNDPEGNRVEVPLADIPPLRLPPEPEGEEAPGEPGSEPVEAVLPAAEPTEGSTSESSSP
jgi:hypothetical protein